MIPALVVGGGALGALLRWLVATAFERAGRFPWAVLVVNVIGSALAGVVLGLAERAAFGEDVRLILLTGVCSGLTTFSTFGVETVQLVLQRRIGTAALSVAANVVLGVGACMLGYLLAR